MIQRIFSQWFRLIRAHPLRNILLILTTAIGTGALALSFQTTARLDRLVEETTGGADRRIVIANGEIGVDGALSWTMPFQFSADDREVFTSSVKGVKAVSIVNQMPMDQIKVNNNYWKPSGVLGTDEFYASVMGLKIVAGNYFSPVNLLSKEKVIVISERAATVLFGSAESANGQKIEVDNGFRMQTRTVAGGRGTNAETQFSPWSTYTIIGVFSDPTRFEADNYGIKDYLVPYTSMLPSNMNFAMPVRMFVARTSSTAVENIAAAIRTEMDTRSGTQVKVSVWEGSPESPGVSTIEKARQSLHDLSLVTSGLGFLILIIAAFGIVSGLLVDAADRSKEIALKRAIGMTITKGTIDLCTRSMALAGAGGLIGLLIATLFSSSMRTILIPYLDALGIRSGDLSSRIFEIRTILAPVAALSLAFVFSLMPASRAASLPIVNGLNE
ncbi:MAG TPA: ABC transporter permease [Treponemataceae bacterium]|nr:ABC transporter permease [Treponemataceae bacterium]